MSDSETVELDIIAKLEAMLFVTGEAATVQQLAAALDADPTVVESGLVRLESVLKTRGLRLLRHAGRVKLTTAPELAGVVERFLGLEAITHLSRAALETLAIISYQQPATRPQIDSIRGVNSDSMLRSLISKGLIIESGRAEGPGRPILYSTAPEFLQHFGLGSISDLPPLSITTDEKESGQTQLLKE